MRISDWSSDVCSSDLNAAGGGKLCLTQTERLAFLANDFSYGISVEHHGFPDRDIMNLFVPTQQKYSRSVNLSAQSYARLQFLPFGNIYCTRQCQCQRTFHEANNEFVTFRSEENTYELQ